MANVALFLTNQIPQYLRSVNTQDYSANPDALINPDLSAVALVPLKYWKRSGSLVLEQTAGEKTATDAALAAAFTASNRTSADVLKDATTDGGTAFRAQVLMLLDEFNTLRQWTVSLKAEIAAASSLANLQTRVATLPTLADRTLAQAKTAYKNKIDSGSAD